MKNNFNTLRQYLFENSKYECTKEALDCLFRAVLEPLFCNQSFECTVLIRLDDNNDKKQLLQRLTFSNANIINFGGMENQRADIFKETEFVIILGQRYSAALLWDFTCSQKNNSALTMLRYNSKTINDLVKKISDNSVVDFKSYISERRENMLLNQSVSQIISYLNDKTEEIQFCNNSSSNDDDTLITAQIVAEKAKFIAHEIKNSLSVINLYSKIIQKRMDFISSDNEIISSLNNAVNCIKNSSENISSQISDLRCLSLPYISEVNAQSLISLIVLQCGEKAKNAGVQLICDELPSVIIKTDKTKLECALTNVIYNAIEACNPGDIVKISCKSEKDKFTITVKNNGKQILEENKSKIFDENFTTKEKGNGLGLCICKKQMLSVNGDINLVSSTEKETVFEIVLNS